MAKTKQALPQLHAHAAGIDIGSESIFTSVGPRRGSNNLIRSPASLEQARDYLLEEGITTVAMEATGRVLGGAL